MSLNVYEPLAVPLTPPASVSVFAETSTDVPCVLFRTFTEFGKLVAVVCPLFFMVREKVADSPTVATVGVTKFGAGGVRSAGVSGGGFTVMVTFFVSDPVPNAFVALQVTEYVVVVVGATAYEPAVAFPVENCGEVQLVAPLEDQVIVEEFPEVMVVGFAESVVVTVGGVFGATVILVHSPQLFVSSLSLTTLPLPEVLVSAQIRTEYELVLLNVYEPLAVPLAPGARESVFAETQEETLVVLLRIFIEFGKLFPAVCPLFLILREKVVATPTVADVGETYFGAIGSRSAGAGGGGLTVTVVDAYPYPVPYAFDAEQVT